MSKRLPPRRPELTHVAQRTLLAAAPSGRGIVEPARWSAFVTLDLTTAPDDGTEHVFPLVRWQGDARDGDGVTVTGFARRGTSTQFLALAKARMVSRCDGIQIDEEWPWNPAGWSRRVNADSVEVFVVFRRQEADVEVYELGAALAERQAPQQIVVADLDPSLIAGAPGTFRALRAPVGTTAVRLHGTPSPDGAIAWCLDQGLGIVYPTLAQSQPGAAGSPFIAGPQEPAVNFLDWRPWNARFGAIAYGIDVLGAVPRCHVSFLVG